MALDTDVRHLLPTVQVPTLVLHRRGDHAVSVHVGRWMASKIPGARFVELPGIDHQLWWGETETMIGEIEEFVTGVRSPHGAERVLASVLFTDIVGSTERVMAVGDRPPRAARRARPHLHSPRRTRWWKRRQDDR